MWQFLCLVIQLLLNPSCHCFLPAEVLWPPPPSASLPVSSRTWSRGWGCLQPCWVCLLVWGAQKWSCRRCSSMRGWSAKTTGPTTRHLRLNMPGVNEIDSTNFFKSRLPHLSQRILYSHSTQVSFFAACRMSSPGFRLNWSACWVTNRFSRRNCSCCWPSSEDNCWTKQESWKSFDCRWTKTQRQEPSCKTESWNMCSMCLLSRWWLRSGSSCSELRCSRRWRLQSEKGSINWKRSVSINILMYVSH